MTPASVEQVAAVAEAALGQPVAAANALALGTYLGLLARWNTTHNLTAIRDPAQMLTHHLADCVAVLPALLRHLARHPARRVLDVGSGGGLPGVIIAIMAPQLDVTCVDSVGKKAAFIRHAAGELALPNLHAEHARVEDLHPAERFDVITSRAFATLADFVNASRHLVAPGGVWMAMKGRAPDDEVAELPADVEVFHVKPLRVPSLDAQRCLVWMRARRPL